MRLTPGERFGAFVAAFAATVAFGAAGCGPNNGDDADTYLPPLDTYEEDASDVPTDVDDGDVHVKRDAGDTGVDADGGDGADLCGGSTCAMNEVCDDGTCVDLGKLKCGTAPSEGTIKPGNTVSLTGTFEGEATDGLSTACAGRAQVPERVYKFQVAERTKVDVVSNFPSGFDAKIEFREGSCVEPESDATTCIDRDQAVWFDGGTTVYAVVENDTGGSGAFQIDLKGTDAVCKTGTFTCASSTKRQYCRNDNGTATPVKFRCPTRCRGDKCTGSSCDDPIPLSSSGNYEGDLEAYDGQMNFEKAQNCEVGSSGTDPVSAGPEVVFAVSMQKGETLTVDTSRDNLDNLIFVADSCNSDVSKITCLAASDETGGKDVLSGWKAPSTGTYYVFVDKWSTKLGPFAYDFTIK